MRYHILLTSLGREKIHLLGKPDGLKQSHLEGKGMPLATALASGASYRKDPDGGNKLTDILGHPAHSLVVSEKALAILRNEPNPFEAYPTPITDPKKDTTITGYTLFHVLDSIDCVDLQRSDIIFSPLLPDRADMIKELHLNPDKIPPERTLFRIKHKPSLKIIREDLVERLRDAGVTGFDLLEMGSRTLL